MKYEEEKPCDECGVDLNVDHTNRGYILRCRNVQCTVNEVRELSARGLFIQRQQQEQANDDS